MLTTKQASGRPGMTHAYILAMLVTGPPSDWEVKEVKSKPSGITAAAYFKYFVSVSAFTWVYCF